jgi:hypothetical protein
VAPLRTASYPGILYLGLTFLSLQAAELRKPTLEAFERYIRGTEARLDERVRAGNFLWSDDDPARASRVRGGEVVIRPWNAGGEVEIKDGLIHDWIGALFIPGATLETVLTTVQSYGNHKNTHKPEVIDSKLLTRQGNDFKIYLRLRKKKVLTVVLNTEHDVRYVPLDATRTHSRSYSTKIAEVADAGEPGEKELPAGKDHGFLWRLYSYWRFEEKDGGVYVECQAVSLTRDVPFGLGWLVTPIIRDLPRESLAATLASTRRAVQTRGPASNGAAASPDLRLP